MRKKVGRGERSTESAVRARTKHDCVALGLEGAPGEGPSVRLGRVIAQRVGRHVLRERAVQRLAGMRQPCL